MRSYSFEKLKVWQKSRSLAVVIYQTTADFPEAEKFGLISQMRRCVLSISSNIAEGSGRISGKDKARFTEIAYSSGLELLNQIIISSDMKLISYERHEQLRNDLSEILAMLDGLYKSHLRN